MKRNLLLLLLPLLCTFTVSAESLSSPWWGVRGGVTFSNLSSEVFSTSYLTGYSAGVAYHHPISLTIPIFIESGLYFERRGAKDNGFLTDSSDRSTLIVNELEVPLLFGYHTNLQRGWAIESVVGLYYSVALNGSFKMDSGSFDPFKEVMLKTLRDARPSSIQLLNRSDFGLRVGVSVLYRRYLFGFTFDGGVLNTYSGVMRKLGYRALTGCATLYLGYNF